MVFYGDQSVYIYGVDDNPGDVNGDIDYELSHYLHLPRSFVSRDLVPKMKLIYKSTLNGTRGDIYERTQEEGEGGCVGGHCLTSP